MQGRLSKILKSSVSTRWNSTVTMISSIIDVYDKINNILLEKEEVHRLENLLMFCNKFVTS